MVLLRTLKSLADENFAHGCSTEIDASGWNVLQLCCDISSTDIQGVDWMVTIATCLLYALATHGCEDRMSILQCTSTGQAHSCCCKPAPEEARFSVQRASLRQCHPGIRGAGGCELYLRQVILLQMHRGELHTCYCSSRLGNNHALSMAVSSILAEAKLPT